MIGLAINLEFLNKSLLINLMNLLVQNFINAAIIKVKKYKFKH